MNFTELCNKVEILARPTTPQFERMTTYDVRMFYAEREMRLKFHCGYALDKPTSKDVLENILQDLSVSEMSFEEFCSYYGYDEDSRKAYDTYEAILSQNTQLEEFLGDDLETFKTAFQEYLYNE